MPTVYAVACLWQKKTETTVSSHVLLYSMPARTSAEARKIAEKRGRAQLAEMGETGFEPVLWNDLSLQV